MKRVRLFIIWALLCAAFTSYGQKNGERINKVPRDSIEFFEAISKFMRDARKDEAKEFLEKFEPAWFSGIYSDKVKLTIYETCDVMLEKHMLPFPEFKEYLETTEYILKAGKGDPEFFNWHKGYDHLLKGKGRRRILEYLDFTDHLYNDNALYQTPGVEWRGDNNGFQLRFDEKFNPVVIFKEVNLICLSRGDSGIIYNTKGEYHFHERTWYGDGGDVFWDRAGLLRDEVNAKLSKYRIDVRRAQYEAKDVVFVNKNFFGNATLKGNLTEKVLANVAVDNAIYPRFVSHTDRLKVNNIIPSVDYNGGFTQKGNRIVGSETDDEKAILKFRRGDEVLLTVKASNFIIRETQISNDKAEITFHFEGDSIFHPGVDFKLKSDLRVVTMTRTKHGVHLNPFYNTYHEIDMYFETLEWNIDKDLILMKPMFRSSDRKAVFESNEYFKEYRFDQLYGLAKTNPLVILRRCEGRNTNMMTATQAAQCFGISESSVKPFLMELSTMGFLKYDFDKDFIEINPKVDHYVLSKMKKEDYDIIEIHSEPSQGNNAELNLMNMEMTMNGIRRIGLSDSHNVFIYPTGGTVVMKKNRDFDVTGVVTAGRLEYFGKNFSFEYDSFKIDMPIVDSLRLYVETEKKDRYGMPELKRVETVIENINGVLEVDKPNNKSGIIPVKKYPRFTSFKESYAYYDKKNILDGVYDRERFYFKLDPFEFDSLDNFQNKSIHFSGTLTSSGIFEDIEEELSLQKDYSLGFRHPTPEEGLDTYGGKGKFYDDILLSHDGLKGNGYIEYLTSTTESESFFFYPDSMNAIAQNYVIEEQMGKVEYPPVSGSDVDWHWQPYRDTMIVRSLSQPIHFYDGNSVLTGHITYTPDSLTGGGTFEFENAIMESKLMTFKFSEFMADTADFHLKSGSLGGIAFETNNMKAHIDFKARRGDFVANGESSLIHFKENQYIAKMDRFSWFMDQEMVELSGKQRKVQKGAQSVDIEGAKLTSVHPDQDSLFFFSSACQWDVRRNILTANKVEQIEVADAIIYPDSQRVVVRKQADMKPLRNAEIIANAVTRYHKLYSANVKILGKKKYTGSAKYDYIDERGEKELIVFDELGVDNGGQTVAGGRLTEADKFTLSPDFKFYGHVDLYAAQQNLTFNGNAQIKHFCQGLPAPWFKFESQIDPNDIAIPVDSTVSSETGVPLKKGIILSWDPTKLYPTFISKPIRKLDTEVITANGFLVFDKTDKKYKISNLAKLEEPSLPGRYLSFNRETCELFGEGKMNFGTYLGRVGIIPYGNATYNVKEDTIGMDVSIILDFFFEEKALRVFSKELEERTDLDRFDFDQDSYQKNLKEMVGETDGLKLISDLSFYGSYKKFPKELDKSLVFSQVRMRWDPVSEAYESVGDIGINNILKKEVFKVVEGYIQIKKRRSGDVLNIYLELDDKTWYYFTYQTEILQAISSNEEFNQKILDVKAGKNKLEREKGQAKYKFMLGNKSKKSAFLRSMEE